jgi:hypothetical protein
MERAFQREKFKDAIHYVVSRVGARPGFGATKLYKVLWFSEARTFALTGECMFNAEFVREKYGPVPKSALKLREELANEGRVKIWQDRFGNRPIWRFKAVVPVSTIRFTAEELQTLDYWAKHIDEDHTAETISDESHDYGWQIAKMGERLPVFAFLAERLREPTEQELAKARSKMGYLGI